MITRLQNINRHPLYSKDKEYFEYLFRFFLKMSLFDQLKHQPVKGFKRAGGIRFGDGDLHLPVYANWF